MPKAKKTFRVDKRKLLDAAFRAGQLNTSVCDIGLAQWKEELEADHPTQTKAEVTAAYRAANPRDPNFSQECAAEFNRGLDAIFVDFHMQQKRNERERHADVYNARKHILSELLTTKIFHTNEKGNITTINPGILKIFEIKHIEDKDNGNTPEGTDIANKLLDAAGLLNTLATTAGTSDVSQPDGSTNDIEASGESN